MSSETLPRLERAPERRIATAYFPNSPAATVRESIFSESLSTILGSEPNSTVEELEAALRDHRDLQDEAAADTAIAAFREAYLTSGERGARGGSAQDYIIPFHPKIAKTIRPEEGRNWGQWYRLLMTTGDPPTFREDVHETFVETLEGLNPSNLFEQLILEATEQLDQSDTPGIDREPVPPYVPGYSETFVTDLQAWMDSLEESTPSIWLRALRDLVCYHYMMYFMQLARNLAAEFRAIANGERYVPQVDPVHFAMWDETASQDREFRHEWDDITRALYESWGRLVATREVVAVGQSDRAAKGGIEQRPYTVSEAIETFPEELKRECVRRINAHYPEEERPPDDLSLGEAALKMAQAVRVYNESQGGLSSQSAYTLSYRVVRQLGNGTERQYFRTQGGIGSTSRLNRGALRLFARLFTKVGESNHINDFETYLRERGITMDERTRETMIEQLESLGLIHKQSDSGEAVYVRTL